MVIVCVDPVLRNKKGKLLIFQIKLNFSICVFSDIIHCPECDTEIPKANLKPDRGCQNELQKLLIICWFCDWNGSLKNYPVSSRFSFRVNRVIYDFYFQGHLVQNHSTQTCDYCGECFSNVPEFDQHQLYHCKKVLVFCSLKSLGCEEMVNSD